MLAMMLILLAGAALADPYYVDPLWQDHGGPIKN